MVAPEARRSPFGEDEGSSLPLERGAVTCGRRPECPTMSVKRGRITRSCWPGGMTPSGAGIGGTTIAMMRGAGVTIDAHPPSTAKTTRHTAFRKPPCRFTLAHRSGELFVSLWRIIGQTFAVAEAALAGLGRRDRLSRRSCPPSAAQPAVAPGLGR